MSQNNDLDAIVDALQAPEPAPEVEIKVTTLGIPPESKKCPAGTTVAEFKAANGFAGCKLATKNEDGSARILSDDEVITSNMSLYTATAKKNG